MKRVSFGANYVSTIQPFAYEFEHRKRDNIACPFCRHGSSGDSGKGGHSILRSRVKILDNRSGTGFHPKASSPLPNHILPSALRNRTFEIDLSAIRPEASTVAYKVPRPKVRTKPEAAALAMSQTPLATNNSNVSGKRISFGNPLTQQPISPLAEDCVIDSKSIPITGIHDSMAVSNLVRNSMLPPMCEPPKEQWVRYPLDRSDGPSENPFSPQKALFHEADPIVQAYKNGIPPSFLLPSPHPLNDNIDSTHDVISRRHSPTPLRSPPALANGSLVKSAATSPPNGKRLSLSSPLAKAGDPLTDGKEVVAESVLVPGSDRAITGRVKVETVLVSKNGRHDSQDPKSEGSNRCCGGCVIC